MPTCLIGLGSNLEPREANLLRAIEILSENPNFTLLAQSKNYQTLPIGGPEKQGPYLNAALRGETSLLPQQLLSLLQQVEKELGRERKTRWAARTIDLDLLLYDELSLTTQTLVLPHPRMCYRRFVLIPAVEVAAEMLHPATGWTVRKLLEHLETTDNYLAIAGVERSVRTKLAERVADITGARLVLDIGETGTEQFQRRVELLVKNVPPPEFVVSDFWFEQSAFKARTSLSGSQLVTFEETYRAARSRVHSPKLLVVLQAESSLEQADLDKLVTNTIQGPVLWLNAADRETAVIETAAAVEAMRQ